MSERRLPTERDFDPGGSGFLDAKWAWKNFGGLTIEQAQARFLENPQGYQEDFMFMGGNAFAFYFPVIENFLMAAPDCTEDNDHKDVAWILSQAIEPHFEGNVLPRVQHLADRVIALSNFVLSNIRRFGYDEDERRRVADGWSELARVVRASKAS